jgi:hypothetical protein
MSFRRKSPGSHAEALIKNHSENSTCYDDDLQEERVRLLVLALITGANDLRALANVRVGAFVLRYCRVLQQPGQQPYVQLPQQEETKVELAPITVIDDQSLEEEIKTTILAAWQAAL